MQKIPRQRAILRDTTVQVLAGGRDSDPPYRVRDLGFPAVEDQLLLSSPLM
jgi:hypothetical protein